MNRYYVVLLVLYIVSIIATNVTKAANRQWRNSAHFQNTQSSIKCPLCIMMVNVARNLIVKSRSFQTIHYIIREMCSVVLSYSIVCYDVASQIVDSYVVIFNRTEALETCMQVKLCN
ncbi:hypothetical protein KSF78_0007312 [Schistosoma japonicum]|nr:hypothetical protein KSF78_0007312 [Schistosoma japonicum]